MIPQKKPWLRDANHEDNQTGDVLAWPIDGVTHYYVCWRNEDSEYLGKSADDPVRSRIL